MNHPSFEELLAARESGDDDLVEHLVTGCALCSGRRRLLDELFAALVEAPLPVPTPRQLAFAESIPERERSRTTSFTRWLASRLDPRAGGLATPALRGVSASAPRLSFAAGPYRIELEHFDGSTLAGHVEVPHDDDPLLGGGICLLVGNGLLREAPVGAAGDFHLGEVPPGSYALLLEAPGVELRLPLLELAGEVDR